MGTAISEDALDAIFLKARSFNGYKDEQVTLDQIRRIWDIMKWGPTSANTLPARVVWVTTQDSKERLAKLCDEMNRWKVLKAPVTAIIGMDEKFYDHLPTLFPHVDVRPYFTSNQERCLSSAFRNSSLQGAYLLIAARAIGLDVGPISGFDNDAVDKEFFSDSGFKSNFISTIGYGDTSTIFDRLPRPEFDLFNSVV